MKLLLPALPLFLAAALACAADPGTIPWEENYQQALTEAKSKGKLLLLDFTGSDWCGWCIKMNKDVLSRPEFLAWAEQNLVLVEVDFPRQKPVAPETKSQNAKLQGQFNVHGFPTFLLLDSEGRKVTQLVGYQKGGPEAFIASLEKAKGDLASGKISLASPEPTALAKTPDEPPPTPTPKPAAQAVTPELKRAADLALNGRLMGSESLIAGLKQPTHEKLSLLPPSQNPLSGREIADRARAGYVRVGWYYHCSKCGNWHILAAGGYAIAENTVATAYHVLETPATMRNGEGHPIAIRGESEVLPVVAVLAADKETDVVILRLGASKLSPLPLADDVSIGDTVFCLSDPRGARGYFSSGIVNRAFSKMPAAAQDIRFQRLNVSTDWAPGSSGAAVLDQRGNVIGHVARISSILNDEHTESAKTKPETLMNLHEAIPAKSVLALIAK